METIRAKYEREMDELGVRARAELVARFAALLAKHKGKMLMFTESAEWGPGFDYNLPEGLLPPSMMYSKREEKPDCPVVNQYGQALTELPMDMLFKMEELVEAGKFEAMRFDRFRSLCDDAARKLEEWERDRQAGK